MVCAVPQDLVVFLKAIECNLMQKEDADFLK